MGWVCSLIVDGKISEVLTWNRLTPKMVMLVLVTITGIIYVYTVDAFRGFRTVDPDWEPLIVVRDVEM